MPDESVDLNKWGLEELRKAIVEFQDHQFAISLQSEDEFNLTRG
jgi:hypothetical protein